MSKMNLKTAKDKDIVLSKKDKNKPAKRGIKSRIPEGETYVKIHPDISKSNLRKLKMIMAREDKYLWEIIEEAISKIK